MKKMKKLLSVGFTILLLSGSLLGMAGCNILNKWTKFYNAKTLESLSLEKLPKPDFDYKGHDNIFRSIRGDIEEEAFNAYAQELFTYMDEKFEYLGAGGEYISDPHVWDPSQRYIACERELENYRSEYRLEDGTLQSYSYTFYYFEEEPSQENEWATCNYVKISYCLDNWQQTNKKEDGSTYVKYTYNFVISLKNFGVENEFKYVEAMLADTYEAVNPECGEASVLHYYGRYNDYRYYAVMMEATGLSFDEALWTEAVGGLLFHYPNGNRILVTNGYDGNFVTLTEAYERGWLDKGALVEIEAKHREAYPYLYTATTLEYETQRFLAGYWDENKDYPCISVCRTLEELTAYCERENVESPSAYDEAFFAEKTLLLIETATGNSAYSWSVAGVEKTEAAALNVYVKLSTLADAGAAVMNSECLLIILDKADFNGVEADVVLINV